MLNSNCPNSGSILMPCRPSSPPVMSRAIGEFVHDRHDRQGQHEKRHACRMQDHGPGDEADDAGEHGRGGEAVQRIV
jgi:hypothetical protein